MTLRLLHLADVHLERAFAGVGAYGEVAHRRREGLRQAMRGAGELARSLGVDAVTIGGDLYEDERSGPQTGAFLSDLFESWQPARVFLVAGNHDPCTPGSVYMRTTWPENVHVFTEQTLRPVDLGGGVTLWGLSHSGPSWSGDPLECPPIGSEGGVHVALFHGAELGSRPRNTSIHGPFHAQRIRERGFSVALCGHYHRRRLDTVAGLVYPGSPEPLTFDEDGDRGPVLVEIDAGGSVRLEGLAANRWHALQAEADVDGAQSAAEVYERARRAAVAALVGLPGDRAMLRITLRGDVAAEVNVDSLVVEAAVVDATGAAVVRVRDLTRPDVDVADAAADPTTRGEFARALLAEIEGEADPSRRSVAEDALRYGLQALGDVEVGLR
ncbi:MAG TPA: metallophosphoesterase [Candidatus Dormibacteraeota bacterium]|nr:metallophosphoesterase [Candidatus Dormibacteraeota bacterium]